MKIYAESHIGCVREENQDAYAIRRICDGALAVICDGMGGAAGGRIAADAASGTFCQRFSKAYEEMIGAGVVTAFDLHRVYSDAVYAANQKVFERAVTTPDLKGMGTTLSAAYVAGDQLYAANIGDSRVYRYRSNNLLRISHDDSFVQQMIDAGNLTEEEACRSDSRHLLTRALGTAPYVEFGFYTADVMSGDRILLCSDGLTTHYRDEELTALLCKEEDVTSLVKALLAGACARGGKDNITIVCIQIE